MDKYLFLFMLVLSSVVYADGCPSTTPCRGDYNYNSNDYDPPTGEQSAACAIATANWNRDVCGLTQCPDGQWLAVCPPITPPPPPSHPCEPGTHKSTATIGDTIDQCVPDIPPKNCGDDGYWDPVRSPIEGCIPNPPSPDVHGCPNAGDTWCSIWQMCIPSTSVCANNVPPPPPPPKCPDGTPQPADGSPCPVPPPPPPPKCPDGTLQPADGSPCPVPPSTPPDTGTGTGDTGTGTGSGDTGTGAGSGDTGNGTTGGTNTSTDSNTSSGGGTTGGTNTSTGSNTSAGGGTTGGGDNSAALDKNTASTDKNTASTDKNTASADKNTASTDKNTASTDKNTASADKNTASTDKNTDSTDKNTTATDSNTSAVNGNTLGIGALKGSIDGLKDSINNAGAGSSPVTAGALAKHRDLPVKSPKFYEPTDKTVSTAFDDGFDRLKGNAVSQSFKGMFTLNSLSCACPSWHLYDLLGSGKTLDVDIFCNDAADKLFAVVKGVIHVLAAYMAVRIAMGGWK